MDFLPDNLWPHDAQLINPEIKNYWNSSDAFISRDLINYPANHLGPAELEDYVKSFAEFHKTKFSSIKGEELKKQNLPLIHDVGRASEQEPRLLEIEYGSKNASYSITLVGKGVCFDSGGLNLKKRGNKNLEFNN